MRYDAMRWNISVDRKRRTTPWTCSTMKDHVINKIIFRARLPARNCFFEQFLTHSFHSFISFQMILFNSFLCFDFFFFKYDFYLSRILISNFIMSFYCFCRLSFVALKPNWSRYNDNRRTYWYPYDTLVSSANSYNFPQNHKKWPIVYFLFFIFFKSDIWNEMVTVKTNHFHL